MAILVRVSEWGNSLAIRLPKAVVEQLGLRAGVDAELDLEGNSARLSARPTQRLPSLEDMVSEARRLRESGVKEPDSVDWGPDVGAETLPDEDWSQEYAAWEKSQA